MERQLAVIGAGYVGLTVAACFAQLGHRVHCIESDAAKAAALQEGRLPIREPGLEPLWRRHLRAGRLRVFQRSMEGLPGAEFVFLCVGTPAAPDGSADLGQVWSAVEELARAMPAGSQGILAVKSTVPPGTSRLLAGTLRRLRPDLRLPVVVNPEFLREGQALADFLAPSRIVIGAEDEEAARSLEELYRPLSAPIVRCRPASAELAKYACNAFLAARISLMNEMAELAEALQADIREVAAVMGRDPRIGPAYLEAGLGWGGSCLPKDLRALLALAATLAVPAPLLEGTMRTNRRQIARVVERLGSCLGTLAGKRVTVWGLAFKPQCDDTRDSPAVALARALQEEGAQVTVYDPLASSPEFAVLRDPYQAAEGADAIVLATAWPQLRAVDWHRLRSLVRFPLVIDGRNVLDEEAARAAGFLCLALGRPETTVPVRPSVEG